jgi:hypothetical protein
MQTTKITFLAVLLAHFLGDFVFQTKRIIAAKDGVSGYLQHGVIHLGLLIGCLWFVGHQMVSWYIQLLLISYIAIHLLLDFVKHTFVKHKRASDTAAMFIADQVLHVASISALVLLMERLKWKEFIAQFRWSIETRERVMIVIIVYTATVFGGGYLIRYLTRSLAIQLNSNSTDETEQELRNAGMYIGWLERFLVISAMIVQSPALIGLILTGKSIARFPELKEARFSEYFLIGTSLSIALALVAGLILVHIFYGTISFK